ncbi:hypothetical protein HYH03_017950 [Edaphochlamys debaryana]|uniref:Protein kinase domain-containing protein n=1 Tax=Edaphochlamys debaryana TaxID=47281 RepID=A0A835XI16_9CHLO|nr:hypothetical protein HYH03_017950 [Edaphochlamys debaryana]|eukprot:KAG2483158.1 hypothetical protein HYH03_017950 [Edaphochlamys debaryana]
MRLALREVRMLKAVSHTNCVKLLDAFRSKSGKVYLIFEYVEGSAYKELTIHRQGLPPQNLKLLAFQLCLSLRYLHSEKMVHRDLKPANILIDDAGVVKLCDFGFARFTNCADPRDAERMSSYVVTRWYRAPEVLLSMEYGPAADIWAMGCTIAELAMGEPLMPGTSTVDQLWRIMRIFGGLPPAMAARCLDDERLAALRVPPRGRTLAQRLSRLGPRMVQFLEACLRLEPRSRPTADELLRMPYFFEIPSLVVATPLEEHVMRELASPGGPPKPLQPTAPVAAAPPAARLAAQQAAADTDMAEASPRQTQAQAQAQAQAQEAPVQAQAQVQAQEAQEAQEPSRFQLALHEQADRAAAAAAARSAASFSQQQAGVSVGALCGVEAEAESQHAEASAPGTPSTPAGADAAAGTNSSVKRGASEPCAVLCDDALTPRSAPAPPGLAASALSACVGGPEATSGPSPSPPGSTRGGLEPGCSPGRGPLAPTTPDAAPADSAPAHPPLGALHSRATSGGFDPAALTEAGCTTAHGSAGCGVSLGGGLLPATTTSGYGLGDALGLGLGEQSSAAAAAAGVAARQDLLQPHLAAAAASDDPGPGSLSLKLAGSRREAEAAHASTGGRAQGSMPGNQPSLQGWAGSHTADGHAVGVLALAAEAAGPRGGGAAPAPLGQSYAEMEAAVSLTPHPPLEARSSKRLGSGTVPSLGGSAPSSTVGGSGPGTGPGTGSTGSSTLRKVRALANTAEVARCRAEFLEAEQAAAAGAAASVAPQLPGAGYAAAAALAAGEPATLVLPQGPPPTQMTQLVLAQAGAGAPPAVPLAAFLSAGSRRGADVGGFFGASVPLPRIDAGGRRPGAGPGAGGGHSPLRAAEASSCALPLPLPLPAHPPPLPTAAAGSSQSCTARASPFSVRSAGSRGQLLLSADLTAAVAGASEGGPAGATGPAAALSSCASGPFFLATSNDLYVDLCEVGTPTGAPSLPPAAGTVLPHRRPPPLSRMPSNPLSSCGSQLSGAWSPCLLPHGASLSQLPLEPQYHSALGLGGYSSGGLSPAAANRSASGFASSVGGGRATSPAPTPPGAHSAVSMTAVTGGPHPLHAHHHHHHHHHRIVALKERRTASGTLGPLHLGPAHATASGGSSPGGAAHHPPLRHVSTAGGYGGIGSYGFTAVETAPVQVGQYARRATPSMPGSMPGSPGTGVGMYGSGGGAYASAGGAYGSAGGAYGSAGGVAAVGAVGSVSAHVGMSLGGLSLSGDATGCRLLPDGSLQGGGGGGRLGGHVLAGLTRRVGPAAGAGRGCWKGAAVATPSALAYLRLPVACEAGGMGQWVCTPAAWDPAERSNGPRDAASGGSAASLGSSAHTPLGSGPLTRLGSGGRHGLLLPAPISIPGASSSAHGSDPGADLPRSPRTNRLLAQSKSSRLAQAASAGGGVWAATPPGAGASTGGGGGLDVSPARVPSSPRIAGRLTLAHAASLNRCGSKPGTASPWAVPEDEEGEDEAAAAAAATAPANVLAGRGTCGGDSAESAHGRLISDGGAAPAGAASAAGSASASASGLPRPGSGRLSLHLPRLGGSSRAASSSDGGALPRTGSTSEAGSDGSKAAQSLLQRAKGKLKRIFTGSRVSGGSGERASVHGGERLSSGGGEPAGRA